MSRIQRAFDNHQAYVAYLTAGDGGLEHTLNAAKALIAGGIDILEIGVPFSDPVADGPTIQAASQRALQAGTTLQNVLELVRSLRKISEIPLILFSYFNPIFLAGENFYSKAKAAGIDGCLIVDLPLEEASDHIQLCKTNKINPIFLISPSTPSTRIEKISQVGEGMLYYVCRRGTTGIKSSLPEDFADQLKKIKQATQLPIITGFGISNKAMASEALQYADGFVVGSLFVKAAAETTNYSDLTELAKSLDPRN